jgi:hypothetical protein
MKIAVKEEGNVVMALTSDISDSDSAVYSLLKNVYAALQFFNGSFAAIAEVFHFILSTLNSIVFDSSV